MKKGSSGEAAAGANVLPAYGKQLFLSGQPLGDSRRIVLETPPGDDEISSGSVLALLFLVDEDDVGARPHCAKPVKSGEQPGSREHRRDEHPQPVAARRLTKPLHGRGNLGEGIRQSALQAPAIRRETQAAPLTRQEGDPDVLFEVADLTADGARRDRQLGGCSRHRLQPRDGIEGAKGVERGQISHVPILSFLETVVTDPYKFAV